MAMEMEVDMRSDTVTLPTAAMRQAMFDCEVGDDVLGADPSAVALQEHCAALFGKEAALFVPSGTMGNLICVMVHCDRRGSEAIVGADSHMHLWEQGGMATIAGVHPRPIANQPDGTLAVDDIRRHVRADDAHFPRTRLVCLENTAMRKGGRVLTAEYIDAVGALCEELQLKLHVDGARVANACVALGVAPARLCRAAHSVTMCLSKGLGAPVGSVVMGSAAFIAEARRARKALGGGMRQVGVLAAAGLVAVRDHWERLAEDHRRCKQVAAALAKVPGLRVDVERAQTNILFIEVVRGPHDGNDEANGGGGVSAPLVVARLKEQFGVLVLPLDERHIRAVFNYHVTDAGATQCVRAFTAVMQSLAGAE